MRLLKTLQTEVKVKVKLSLDRSLGLLEVEAPTVSGQSTHGGGKIVSLTHWPPLTP